MSPIVAESVLRGHVYDGSLKCSSKETCISVANAYIIIGSGQNGHNTVTDKEGFYEFSNLPADEYIMSVIAEGHQYHKNIIRIADGENLVDVYLMPFSGYK